MSRCRAYGKVCRIGISILLMSPNSAYGGFSLHAKFVVFLAMLALLAPAVGSQTVSPPPGNPPAPSAPSQAAAASAVRPDAKKIKEAYKQGQRAEQSQDWEVAFQAYSSAVQWAPDNRGYLARREAARSNLVQAKMDLAERDAIAGKIEEAVKDAGEAYRLDPTNTVVGDRLAELIAARPRQIREIPAEPELAERFIWPTTAERGTWSMGGTREAPTRRSGGSSA